MGNLSKLSDEVEASKGELLKLASSLIRAKSENPPGDTSEAANVAEDYLRAIGLGTKRFEPTTGHVNLIAELGSRKDYGLILCGHIDTVPIGDMNRWSFDPFSGEVVEGRILGRGATDMKGGVASVLTAVKALIKHEQGLKDRITVALFCDEETGGQYGARWVLENRLIRGKAMIIGEYSNHHKLGHTIVSGEKGTLWSKLKFVGFSHHGSRPMLGDNAIMHAVRAFKKLKSPILSKVKAPYEAIELVKLGKRALIMNYGNTSSLKPHYSMDHYTLNVGVIKGGVKANIVADSCEVELDLRIPIGGSRAEAEGIMRNLAAGGKIEYTNYAPPSFTPPGSSLIKTLRKASQNIFKESTPAICTSATTDAHHFRSSLNIPVVSYGPGYEEALHVDNESVDVIDVLGCAKVYAQTAMTISS